MVTCTLRGVASLQRQTQRRDDAGGDVRCEREAARVPRFLKQMADKGLEAVIASDAKHYLNAFGPRTQLVISCRLAKA
mgnify:CR=1 FL=1